MDTVAVRHGGSEPSPDKIEVRTVQLHQHGSGLISVRLCCAARQNPAIDAKRSKFLGIMSQKRDMEKADAGSHRPIQLARHRVTIIWSAYGECESMASGTAGST